MAGIGSVNFGGLYSGLDTKQLIEDLMSVESKPLQRLENKKEVRSSTKVLWRKWGKAV